MAGAEGNDLLREVSLPPLRHFLLETSDLRLRGNEAQDVHKQRQRHHSPTNSQHLYERASPSQLQEQSPPQIKINVCNQRKGRILIRLIFNYYPKVYTKTSD